MTLPYERTRAVIGTQEFLLELIDPKKTPRISKDIRQKALWCLRHYPSKYEMEVISERDNGIFGKDFYNEKQI